MAIKTIRVCDRCGKYIEYRGWTARIKGLRFRKIFMRKIFNGNPDGCSYSDWHIDYVQNVPVNLKIFCINRRAENAKV